MSLCNEIIFCQNTMLPAKENRVIILAENHTSKEAAETYQKILELTSLKRLIALDEAINAFHIGINEFHLPLEDSSI